MYSFDAIEYLKNEAEKRNEMSENKIIHIFNELSTKNCEYVDNFNAVYNLAQNISKPMENRQLFNNFSLTQGLVENYNNVSKNSNYWDKYSNLKQYVDNFVDNGVKAEEKYNIINNVDNCLDKMYNTQTENKDLSTYENVTELFKNIQNDNSSQNKNYAFNINMGGITQNFSSDNSDDVLDMLVDKLQNAISGCADGIY